MILWLHGCDSIKVHQNLQNTVETTMAVRSDFTHPWEMPPSKFLISK